MVEPLFQGENVESDLEAFYEALAEIDPSLTEILKTNLHVVSSTKEEKSSRAQFNSLVLAELTKPAMPEEQA